MAGTLYLIPNLLISLPSATSPALARAIPLEVQSLAARLDYFIAENAKTTRAFLKLISTTQPLAQALQAIRISELNINTDPAALPQLLLPLLEGKDGGLISEAGVPAVADPGAALVQLAHQAGITVSPLVGPSSILLALMASGLNGQSFAFNGYLPVDPAERQRRIKALEERSRQENQTQIFIETPYRNGVLLDALSATCHARTLITVATDLTGERELVQTRSAAQWRRDLDAKKLPDFHKQPTVFLLLAL